MPRGRQRQYPLPQPGDISERWTVMQEVPLPPQWKGTYRKRFHWYECQCTCGTIKTLPHPTLQPGANTSKSCGCLQREVARKLGMQKATHHETSHGGIPKKSKEYRAWRHMKSRCLNPNVERYPCYGGRGIDIHPLWLKSFERFLADIGRAPTPQHSLGRIDNNGPYAPGNVRWETPKEQQRNSRHNRFITFKGETLTIGEWAYRTGIKRRTLQMRLDVRHWSIEHALTLPPGQWRNRHTASLAKTNSL
jgi:hypothetical protein